MIRSMTSYVSQDLKSIWGHATWEVRTLNQRYLDIYIRIPEDFRILESKIRQYIRNNLHRGKIECYLTYNPNFHKENNFFINNILINNILQIYNNIKLNHRTINLNFFDLLKWPGIVEKKQDNLDTIKTEIYNIFKQVITKIINVRTNEGIFLKKLIKQRLSLIKKEIIKIRIQIPIISKSYKEKIIFTLQEFNIKIDDYRFSQEILLLIQKSDITEELDRIEIHIIETLNTLNQSEPIGRRLDFIMQELNRETNTIASKSTNAQITISTIEIKVLIEQMREQIQNIE